MHILDASAVSQGEKKKRDIPKNKTDKQQTKNKKQKVG